MSHMFGAWLEGISKKLKCLVLLGSSTIYWSVCLHMNDLVFEKKKKSLFSYVSYILIYSLAS